VDFSRFLCSHQPQAQSLLSITHVLASKQIEKHFDIPFGGGTLALHRRMMPLLMQKTATRVRTAR
jgi:hypothetical protein